MMLLRRFSRILAVPFLVLACDDNDDVDDAEPILEPQASIGEPVVYRGAPGTEVEWELTVTVEGIDCDVEVSDETEVAPAHDRFCVASLRLENSGEEPNVESFAQASSLITDTGELSVADEIASGVYVNEQDLHPLTGVAPGETAETALVFSAPDDAEPAYLHLQAGANDDIVLVDLEADPAGEDS